MQSLASDRPANLFSYEPPIQALSAAVNEIAPFDNFTSASACFTQALACSRNVVPWFD
jgi:hypothetical protein